MPNRDLKKAIDEIGRVMAIATIQLEEIINKKRGKRKEVNEF